MTGSRSRMLLRLLLAMVALGALAYLVLDIHDRFRLGMHPDEVAQAPFQFDWDTRVVDAVQPEASRAGLAPGMVLESLNDRPYTGRVQWTQALQAGPGKPLRVGYGRAPGHGGSGGRVESPSAGVAGTRADGAAHSRVTGPAGARANRLASEREISPLPGRANSREKSPASNRADGSVADPAESQAGSRASRPAGESAGVRADGSGHATALAGSQSGPEPTDAAGEPRPGAWHEATIILAPTPQHAGVRNGFKVAQQLLLLNASALFCLLVGCWVVLAKPAEPNAWLLLGLLLFPEVLFSAATVLDGGAALLFRGMYYVLLQNLSPLALLVFALYFPERSRVDRRLPWFKWAVLAPAVLIAGGDLLRLWQEYFFAGAAPWLAGLMRPADRVENGLDLLCVVLYLLLLLDKLRTASSEDARRRLRVLLSGTGIGLLALLTVFVLLRALGFEPDAPGHLWAAYLGATLFLLAPLTLAYVVLVQRAMDVSILVRQGTRYALARATVWTVQTLLLTLVSWELLQSLLAPRQVTQNRLWQIALFVLLLVLLRYGFQEEWRGWLDKRFFREAYNAEQVLSELSDEVRSYTERAPLLETVAKCVAETLHVSEIGMLLGTGSAFVLTNSAGESAGGLRGELALRADSSAIRKLTYSRTPLRLYRDDPDGWYLLAGEAERRTLDALGAEVLLPLPGRGRLMGVMTLGPKRSEAAYSSADLNLLQVLAVQTGMALEVTELAQTLAREAAQRERAARELEVAGEVQERLFPQRMPEFAGGTVAGACRAAQGVGGDYYDVFALPDGRLGLAIGDVSGKGISAALLMASLRASLRSMVLDGSLYGPESGLGAFGRLMEKLNRLVYESSAESRYATLFFGALDPATRVLECVNAGHNPPLLLRRKPGSALTVRRVQADGPVVGLLPRVCYGQQRVQLERGDLLLCYTDGISEAMTQAEEEWGEARMIAAAEEGMGEPAGLVVERLFAGADRFTEEARQHDDMSLLVVALEE